MPAIFIGFRKADARGARSQVYQALADRFGKNAIFKSGEEIPPGAPYADVLLRQAADCAAMVVLIGPAWLHAHDETGRRLLDRDRDWVRREIATALRSGNLIIPVLLGDAVRLPDGAELSPDIAALTDLQFVRIGKARSDKGLSLLIDTCFRTPAQRRNRSTTGPASPTRSPPGANPCRTRSSTPPTVHLARSYSEAAPSDSASPPARPHRCRRRA